MTNEELVALIQLDINVKENMGSLYCQNKGYIYTIAKTYTGVCDIEELMQEAYLGLHEAVIKYDLNSKYKFISFLGVFVKRKLSNYARSNSYTQMIPRYLVSLMVKYNKYKNEYITRNAGREPSKSEYMQVLGLTESRLNKLINTIEISNGMSLDKELPGTEGLVFADLVADEFNLEVDTVEQLTQIQVKKELWKSVKKLNTKYEDILIKRYILDLSVGEIAKIYNVPECRIKKVEAKALKWLSKDNKIRELGNYRDA